MPRLSFGDWKGANTALDDATSPATPAQLAEAARLGVCVPASMPRLVAGARLRSRLRHVLALPAPRNLSGRYDDRIKALRRDDDPPIDAETDDEAEAWVSYLYLARRRDALASLQLSAGDVVRTRDDVMAIVSSIDDEGRVHFKGGLGARSWPDLLTPVARSDDQTAAAVRARAAAANNVAARRSSDTWSAAKHRELAKFAVRTTASRSDVDDLERVLDEAKDERPIQAYLEQNRHILTALLPGSPRYCLPQVRFASEFVADFVLGTGDSLGVRWTLVELESPRAPIHLVNGKTLAAKAPGAEEQIADWRGWLQDNLAMARRPRGEHGMGLFDISSDVPAIILVGRRSRLRSRHEGRRREHAAGLAVHIHTYDWLLDCLRTSICFEGPSGVNPGSFQRDGSTADTLIPDEHLV